MKSSERQVDAVYLVPPLPINLHGAPQVDWSSMSENEHFVQFYEADAFLMDSISQYIGTALRNGEAGIVITTKAHRDGVDQRLRDGGIDVDSAIATGQYISLDAAETLTQFMVDGVPDASRFSEVIGGIIARPEREYPRLRIFGAMVALLVADGHYDATLRLEDIWNDFRSQHAFSLFCAYPMDHSGGEAITDLFEHISATHGGVIPAESYAALPTSDDRLRSIVALQQKARWLETEIAEREAVEERLRVALAAERAARQDAEDALRLRNEFLSIAAHELKTPLTGLAGRVQLTLRQLNREGEIETGRLTSALSSMSEQADKLSRLLNQLLDVSRLEAGKLRLERQFTDLCSVVEGIVVDARSLSDRHTIALTAPMTLPAVVDSLRLEQVVTNLITNAIKYSPAGGLIDVVLTMTDSDVAELSVTDTGLGIPVEQREEIFERFYQAHSSSQQSGLGLGLYISRQIVELHDGEIRAEFPSSGGTRFIVRLPVAVEHQSAEYVAD